MSNEQTRAVKKTLTIPAWLNTLAEKQDVQFSRVLREALMDAVGVHSYEEFCQLQDCAKRDDWVRVEDALPADNEKVLCFTRSGNLCVARWSKRQEKFITSGNVNVTHWMPLPEPPEGKV